MQMLQGKSWLAHLFLLSILVTPFTSNAATCAQHKSSCEVPFCSNNPVKPQPFKLTASMHPYVSLGIFSFVFASWFMLHNRRPVPNFKSRFDCTLFRSFDIKNKAWWDNLWYLIEDEWVGQRYKAKAKLTVDDKSFKLNLNQIECLPHGVCGHLDTYTVSIQKAAKSMFYCLVMYKVLSEPEFLENWRKLK